VTGGGGGEKKGGKKRLAGAFVLKRFQLSTVFFLNSFARIIRGERKEGKGKKKKLRASSRAQMGQVQTRGGGGKGKRKKRFPLDLRGEKLLAAQGFRLLGFGAGQGHRGEEERGEKEKRKTRPSLVPSLTDRRVSAQYRCREKKGGGGKGKGTTHAICDRHPECFGEPITWGGERGKKGNRGLARSSCGSRPRRVPGKRGGEGEKGERKGSLVFFPCLVPLGQECGKATVKKGGGEAAPVCPCNFGPACHHNWGVKGKGGKKGGEGGKKELPVP